MLVLTRKLDEAIRIGDDIKITVLRVKGNTVRIGIEAPRDVRVVREELDAEEAFSAEDGAVIATVVDSPEPSTSRLFVGKVRIQAGKAPVVAQDSGDQAAPLRAFLRSSCKLQAAAG